MSSISSPISYLRRIFLAIARRTLSSRTKLALEHWHASNSDGGWQFRYLPKFGPNAGIAIDIGANQGLFSYGLAPLYREVQAFEVNPSMIPKLLKSVPKNVVVHHVGLSDVCDVKTLHVPFEHGKMLHGWVSLEDSHCPSADEYEKTEICAATLDSFGFQDVGFIKIDVEGHEAKVLAGARKTLTDSRPNVYVEIQDENLEEIQDFMSALGYQQISLDEYAGARGTHGNFLFTVHKT